MFQKPEYAQRVTVIDAQLEILRRREAEFQRIIEEMQMLRASVRREREELMAEREELDHFRIPIYRMPAEVLIKVFLLAISSEFEEQRFQGGQWPLWTPFNLSHVCHSWHKTITSTSELWSFIALRGTLGQHPGLQEHFRRSLASPLHICYRVSSDISKEEDLQQTTGIMTELEEHFCRIRTFDFQTRTLRAMECCLEGLQKFISASTSRTIDALSLIVTGESSLDFGMGSIYTIGKYTPNPYQTPCRIKTLKSTHLIPFSLPLHIFADLTRLELSFAPKKSPANAVPLRASALFRFLYHTPRLEDLVLFDTVPLVDSSSPEIKVPLLHLRTLDWSDPQVRDVTRLMSFLDTPLLTKFDLWLDGPQQPPFLGSPPSFTAHPPSATATSSVLEYPNLKELNLQCLGDSDSVKYVFGKFLFPTLEKLEIANFAAPGSKEGAEENQQQQQQQQQPLPLSLPALTDIFRDPRLSNLTHLTLCSWTIPSDVGFARAFLGYLPTLTSLTLEKCLNVGTLMQILQELVLVRFIMSKAMPQQRRDVKVCPRLEALTLWGCNDVESACLRGLVLARNRNIEPTCRVVISPSAKLEPNGVSWTPKLEQQAQGNNNGSAPRETEAATKGRAILPLRKTRYQGQSTLPRGYLPHGASSTLPQVTSDTDVTGDLSQHAHILYLRIEDCELIGRVEAESLRSLGVLDVIWS